MSSLNGPSNLHDLYNDVDCSIPRRCSNCSQDIDESMHGSDAGLCHDCACEECEDGIKAPGEMFRCANCAEAANERAFDRWMEQGEDDGPLPVDEQCRRAWAMKEGQ